MTLLQFINNNSATSVIIFALAVYGLVNIVRLVVRH